MTSLLNQRNLTLIVILAVTIVLILVFVALGWLDITRFKRELSILQSAITISAILIGGVFAIVRFQLFRAFEPHLSISQEVSHRFTSDEYVHLAVTAIVKNNSRVRVEINKALRRVQQIRPVTNEQVEELYAQVFVNANYDVMQWPVLGEFRGAWPEGTFVIEPGESHNEVYEFVMASDIETVLVYTYFYNSKYSEGSAEGWPAVTIYDIVSKEVT